MKFLALILTFATIILGGCDQKSKPLGPEYYFPQRNLEKGIVNKYYVHEIPYNRNENTRTNISYRMYELSADDKLLIKGYDAGFLLDQYQEIIFTDSSLLLAREYSISRGDTLEASIVEPTYFNIQEPLRSTVSFERTFKNITYRFSRSIESVRDTIFEESPAKLFQGILTTSIPKMDSIVQVANIVFMYASPYGMVWSKISRPNSVFTSVLVSQYTKSQFDEMSTHDKHRVGFIDPEYTLDSSSDFQICGNERFIADYYNSKPNAGYFPDKKEFLGRVIPTLDSNLFHGASGYLTYRFVINCNGEAGRFTTEEASLDFESTQFSDELVNHIYEILAEQSTWTSLVLFGEPADSYFYITFKFRDGQLIDTLP